MRAQYCLPYKLLAVLLCAVPAMSVAQVGFIVDSMQSNLCLTQNWDTPYVQSWLSRMPRGSRMQVFGSLQGSSASKRCLMEVKPVPVALCERVIAQTLGSNGPPPVGGGMPYLKLSSEESDRVLVALQNKGAACMRKEDKPGDTPVWLPKGLEISATAQAILAAAQAGDRSAQAKAVELYSRGDEIPASEERADFWLTKSAASGDANSQWVLGQAFRYGRSPHSTDYKAALKWLTKAANQGLVPAQAELAFLYESGPESYDEKAKGLKPDPVAAQKWRLQAAGGGDRQSSCLVGRAFRDGIGADINPTQAETWYRKAVSQHNADCMLELAEFLNRTPSQNHQLEAQQLLRKADSLGNNGTTLNLSGYLKWGLHATDDTQRLDLQRKLAEQGDLDAQLAMGQRYFNGVGVTKNQATAISWWRKAAAAGDPIGQRMLGKALLYGWGHDNWQFRPSEQDRNDAKTWLRKAAAQDDAEAAQNLMRLAESEEEAEDWRKKALALGYQFDR